MTNDADTTVINADAATIEVDADHVHVTYQVSDLQHPTTITINKGLLR